MIYKEIILLEEERFISTKALNLGPGVAVNRGGVKAKGRELSRWHERPRKSSLGSTTAFELREVGNLPLRDVFIRNPREIDACFKTLVPGRQKHGFSFLVYTGKYIIRAMVPWPLLVSRRKPACQFPSPLSRDCLSLESLVTSVSEKHSVSLPPQSLLSSQAHTNLNEEGSVLAPVLQVGRDGPLAGCSLHSRQCRVSIGIFY